VTLDRDTMARLLEITGGDQAFIDELVDTFLEDASVQMDALRAAGAAGDIDAVVRPAHSLKSNAVSVGATVLGDLCRPLEADARAGNVPDLAARIAAVEREIDQVRQALLGERSAR
jgi:HPt (histidine-containing phosphotransfer) domain-containing protein